MGRVSDWIIGMEEDATCMSIDEWTNKHGKWNKTVYETVNGEEDDNAKQLTFTQNK